MISAPLIREFLAACRKLSAVTSELPVLQRNQDNLLNRREIRKNKRRVTFSRRNSHCRENRSSSADRIAPPAEARFVEIALPRKRSVARGSSIRRFRLTFSRGIDLRARLGGRMKRLRSKKQFQGTRSKARKLSPRSLLIPGNPR